MTTVYTAAICKRRAPFHLKRRTLDFNFNVTFFLVNGTESSRKAGYFWKSKRIILRNMVNICVSVWSVWSRSEGGERGWEGGYRGACLRRFFGQEPDPTYRHSVQSKALKNSTKKTPSRSHRCAIMGNFRGSASRKALFFQRVAKSFAPDPTQTGSGGGYTGLKNTTTKYSK